MVDLYKPIEAVPGQLAPLVLRAVTQPRMEEIAGGVASSAARAHSYVLLEALPEDLRRRIQLAVQTIIAGR